MLSMTIALFSVIGCNSDTGITPDYPSMAVVPNPIEFYDVQRDRVGTVVGETETVTVTIQNAGRAPLELIDISLGGDPAFTMTAPDVDEVGEDEFTTFTLSFTPTAYETYGDTLIIETNDPDFEGGLSIPITGTGVEIPKPCIAVEPATLDFGDVEPGDYGFDFITVTNCGEDDLSISQVAQTGSGAFSRVSADPVGAVLTPGGTDAVTVNFYYEPTTASGDSGSYVISSDDPNNPEFEVALIGNGGGSGAYPEAVIDCPASATVLDELVLSGSGSFDPDGRAIVSYLWSLDRQPEGSQSALGVTDEVATDLFLDAAGDYVVTLQVTNDAGTLSAPTECRLDAVPQDAIHIELTWSTGDSDFDLHLANRVPDEQGENFFLRSEDVNFCNETADWGAAGDTSDDATLELDDQEGYGPENVSIFEPADGEYLVRAHYFDTASNSETIATVRFYLNGEVWLERERTMERNDVWDVGYVRWPEGVVVVEDDESLNPLYDAPTRECYSE